MTFVLDISTLEVRLLHFLEMWGNKDRVTQRCMPELTPHVSNDTSRHLLNLYTNTTQHFPAVYDNNNYIRCRIPDDLAAI
jgi:hypothetical protein